MSNYVLSDLYSCLMVTDGQWKAVFGPETHSKNTGTIMTGYQKDNVANQKLLSMSNSVLSDLYPCLIHDGQWNALFGQETHSKNTGTIMTGY